PVVTREVTTRPDATGRGLPRTARPNPRADGPNPRADGPNRFAVDSAVGATRAHDPERRPPIARHQTDKEPTRPHGCAQATRLACPPGRATLASRDRPARPRGVFALPRDEAAAPRLPERRLLPGPAGRAAEAGEQQRRRRRPLIPWSASLSTRWVATTARPRSSPGSSPTPARTQTSS